MLRTSDTVDKVKAQIEYIECTTMAPIPELVAAIVAANNKAAADAKTAIEAALTASRSAADAAEASLTAAIHVSIVARHEVGIATLPF